MSHKAFILQPTSISLGHYYALRLKEDMYTKRIDGSCRRQAASHTSVRNDGSCRFLRANFARKRMQHVGFQRKIRAGSLNPISSTYYRNLIVP